MKICPSPSIEGVRDVGIAAQAPRLKYQNLSVMLVEHIYSIFFVFLVLFSIFPNGFLLGIPDGWTDTRFFWTPK